MDTHVCCEHLLVFVDRMSLNIWAQVAPVCAPEDVSVCVPACVCAHTVRG